MTGPGCRRLHGRAFQDAFGLCPSFPLTAQAWPRRLAPPEGNSRRLVQRGHVFPIAPFPLPSPVSSSKSHRLRLRRSRKVAIANIVNGIIHSVSALNEGSCYRRNVTTYRASRSPELIQAHDRSHRPLLAEATRTFRARRDCHCDGGGLSGAGAVGKVIKDPEAPYARRAVPNRMVPLVAHLIAEPSGSECADDLDLLQPDLQELFSCEGDCIDMSCKSSVIFSEIEEKFGFACGSKA